MCHGGRVTIDHSQFTKYIKRKPTNKQYIIE